MMNTVVGSAIGGLMAGAVALGAAAAMKPSPDPAFTQQANGAYGMPVVNTASLNTGGSLQCHPYEEAVLRRAMVAGREVTDVTCITRSGSYSPQAAYAMPVAYREQDVRSVVPARTVTRAQTRAASDRRADRRESDRSWGKTAMIIGGGTGGGAGIGGLIGGKKGALIGAAIGGGAATIYESTKR